MSILVSELNIKIKIPLPPLPFHPHNKLKEHKQNHYWDNKVYMYESSFLFDICLLSSKFTITTQGFIVIFQW